MQAWNPLPMAMSIAMSATRVFPVALQEPVHLDARLHVVVNLVDHAFLRVGQFKREVVLVKDVERLADAREREATVFMALLSGIAQDVELHVKQLFEFQPFLGLLHVAQRLRVVYLP